MGKIIDMLHQLFGRVEVIAYQGVVRNKAIWWCRCDCGNEFSVVGKSLRSHLTKSCGCIQKERAAECATTHGHRKTPEYVAYMNAKARCNNPSCDNYKYYGGRGIKFLFRSFE